MPSDDLEERIAGVASLAEPQRRALYRYVVSRDAPVGKDEAAAAMGVARSVAAFHLDRLVTDGLLTAEFRRLTGRQGPGAGRPAKLYRRVEGDVSVSLPSRRYELAAALLAAAVSDATQTGTPVARAL
ncbi:MAG: transcriptional regulator, partial [Acidimicrobiia bacterium]